MTEQLEESSVSLGPLLEKKFYCYKSKSSVLVALSQKELSFEKTNNLKTKHTVVNLNDITNCKLYRVKRRHKTCRFWSPSVYSEDERINSAFLWITVYVLKMDKEHSKVKREKIVLKLCFQSYDKYEDNVREANMWESTINRLVRYPGLSPLSYKDEDVPESISESNKILVVINQNAGKGDGRRLFQRRVMPLLVESDIDYHLHITGCFGDATSLVKTMDLSHYSGRIVCMGDVGLAFEIINGIFERQDWEVALQMIKIGIIPSRSGNALAKSIAYQTNEPYDTDPILISTLNVIQGRTQPIDLARVEIASKVMFSSLSVGWGLIANIDIASGRLRAMGGRTKFAAKMAVRVLGLTTYAATLSYLPVEGCDTGSISRRAHQPQGTSLSAQSDSQLSIDTIIGNVNDIILDVIGSLDKDTSTEENIAEIQRKISNTSSTSGLASAFPDLSQPVPNDWTVCQGRFVMVYAIHKSHLAEDCLLAPASKLDDKTIWLCIIRSGISKAQLMQYLLGLSSGTYVSVPNTEMLPVRAFRLEPEGTDSCLTVDGQRIPTGPVQVEMAPYTVNVMARSD